MSPSPATWITPLQEGRGGLRVAVKDLIDVAGTPTTAGSRAVAERATAATSDAECLTGLRWAIAAGSASLVGKTNLHELADGITGMNPWFGTPRNPLDPDRVPGGSSSGSAAAVGSGDADVAYGTDTGGSVRIPAACCGVVGLKTTHGRVPTGGVWPLAPSLDTIGPLARDVAGVVAGMGLLEPGFTPGAPPDGPIGRLRPRLEVDPAWDASVDSALREAGLEVVDVELPGWEEAVHAGLDVLGCEALEAHGDMIDAHGAAIGEDVRRNFAFASRVGNQRLRASQAACGAWKRRVQEVFSRVGALALPAAPGPAPAVGPDAGDAMTVAWTIPVNVAGNPALAMPLPRPGGLPASLQLIGPAGGEESLCALAAIVESAVGALR